jgi:1-pyrroline-5-carboxylate dehydrogenase
MSLGLFQVPDPSNESIRSYAPESPGRASLQKKLRDMTGQRLEIPLIIGGQEIRTGRMTQAVMPHDHRHVLADVHLGGEAEARLAVEAARKAKEGWAAMPWEARSAVFLKAAELLAGPWRDTLNAATMLGQSKTVHQAEIDSACELVDFHRFNPAYYRQILAEQPGNAPGVWNRLEYRPLEGFVFAVTPFNFTSIAGNLPTAPALVGNTVLWKPASTALLSGYYLMKLWQAAGLPDGVINFLPGSGSTIGDPVLASEELAGIHFTGSTEVFRNLWRGVAKHLDTYRGYPRLVGETGGKDFVFAHPSADVPSLVTALVRGAFEYQGQKCSAASRAYIPGNLWKQVREPLVELVESISMGDIQDFRHFMGAVIDANAFRDHKRAIEEARDSQDAQVLAGGACDDSLGYFVRPTLIQAKDPMYRTMREELFGPVLTLFVYEAAKWEETLDLVDRTSPYALTGAVFTQDRLALQVCMHKLRNAAGNFYVNDKPTGAVVGQQPFGGARASGTNDKAGSKLNLLRWISPRTIKETFAPPADYRYPYML